MGLLRLALLFIFPVFSSADFGAVPFSPALELAVPSFEVDDFAQFPRLVKRDDGCPSGYDSCAYIGASGFCCASNQNCGIDGRGHAACCPEGAACTGVVGGAPVTIGATTATFAAAAITAGTDSSTKTVTGGHTNTGTAFSIYSNPFFAFHVIPTTYVNAAACSAAWTGCQTDLASCTSFLEGKNGGARVTISAPNLSTTERATTTYASSRAQSICSSLSSAACSGLQVAACSLFGSGNGNGNAANPRPTVMCAAGMGAAVGVAGQWLLG